MDFSFPTAILAGFLSFNAAPAIGDQGAVPPVSASFPVAMRLDAGHSCGEWRHIWRFFGADEPNYATMKDGRKLLGQLGGLAPNQIYFRTHNLLTSGDGTPALKWGSTGAYSEDAGGKPLYNWTILDGIFDAYLANSVRPYVQIGFMPRDLSIRPEPYQHHWQPTAKYNEIFTGWAYPPKDYGKWGELAFQWASHCVEKYGRAEVEQWYWEVWNEPNISYWRGKPEEFLKLHDYAIAGVRRALPTARVGGPDTAGGGGKFLSGFIEHCLHGTNYATGQRGTPLDFVAFHAKGSPKFVKGHVQMGIADQLRTMDAAFQIIASYPELKNKPVVIGESDPDGCAACQGAQLGYRNGTMYSSYTAASIAREYELAEKHGTHLEGTLTWAFEFENQPYFAGFRVLASNGITLPVFNVFRMFSRMAGHRVVVETDASLPLQTVLASGISMQPEVSGLAALGTNRIVILLWHYHDDDLPGPPADISLSLSALPPSRGPARLSHFRVDADHGNAFTAWQQIGSPQQPTAQQYAQLEKSGQLAEIGPAETVQVENSRATVKFSLPRQAVSLLVLDWSKQLPNLFIIGDSTVNNGTKGLQGWGTPIAHYFDSAQIHVQNKARVERSSRTYYTEGLWDQVRDSLKPGDFVLVQFGHNDGGPLADGRARASLKGNGEQTQEIENKTTGKQEVVHTYGWYLRKYIADTKAKGATPIVLSPVPRNIWKAGKVTRAANDYGKWAAEAAKAEAIPFIDLNEIIARHYEDEGQEKVASAYFTAADHTHTTPVGAELNAASVVEGIKGLKNCSLAKSLSAISVK